MVQSLVEYGNSVRIHPISLEMKDRSQGQCFRYSLSTVYGRIRRQCPHPSRLLETKDRSQGRRSRYSSSTFYGMDLLYNSSWKFHQLAARQLLSGQLVRYRYGKGRQYGPSITYKITPAGSLTSSQQGEPPCWASPLACCLTGYYHLLEYLLNAHAYTQSLVDQGSGSVLAFNGLPMYYTNCIFFNTAHMYLYEFAAKFNVIL
jgi:hypothetical protein